jgi:uncharacterized protein YqkB
MAAWVRGKMRECILCRVILEMSSIMGEVELKNKVDKIAYEGSTIRIICGTLLILVFGLFVFVISGDEASATVENYEGSSCDNPNYFYNDCDDYYEWIGFTSTINTNLAPPNIVLTVRVNYPDGTNSDYNEIDYVIYQDSTSNVYSRNKPTSNPMIFSLPRGHSYNVEIYVDDMFQSTTGWLSSSADKTITPENQGRVKIKAYYSDGTTPLPNAYVEVQSHDGAPWRSKNTDSSGETIWFYLMPSTGDTEYYNAVVKLNGVKIGEKTLEVYESQDTIYSINTNLAPPNIVLTVRVKYPDGTNSDYNEIDYVIYQDSTSNVYSRNKPTSNPMGFSLPSGHRYNVEIYVDDMFQSTTGWVSSSADKTITPENQGRVKIKAYYSDGTTPLPNVYVEVQSHDGASWRSGNTDSSGETIWFYLMPSTGATECYKAVVKLNGVKIGERTLEVYESQDTVYGVNTDKQTRSPPSKGNGVWIYGKETSYISDIINHNSISNNDIIYLFTNVGELNLNNLDTSYDTSTASFYKSQLSDLNIYPMVGSFVNLAGNTWGENGIINVRPPLSQSQIETLANNIAIKINSDSNADGLHLDIEPYDDSLISLVKEIRKGTNKSISVAVEFSTPPSELFTETDFVVLMNYDLSDIAPTNLNQYKSSATQRANEFLITAKNSKGFALIGIPVVASNHEWQYKISRTTGVNTQSGYTMEQYLTAALEANDNAINNYGESNYLGISVWSLMSSAGGTPDYYVYPYEISDKAWSILNTNSTSFTYDPYLLEFAS